MKELAESLEARGINEEEVSPIIERVRNLAKEIRSFDGKEQLKQQSKFKKTLELLDKEK